MVVIRGSPLRTLGNNLGEKGNEIIHRKALHHHREPQDERES
jgi:hypothetical protein